jgi:hypothetical protein
VLGALIDGMTVDPLWDSTVTSDNLPVRKLKGSLGATRDTKSGTNDHHEESWRTSRLETKGNKISEL